MKKNQLTTAIGLVDDNLVVEAIHAKAKRRTPIWLRLGVVAACVACMMGVTGLCAYAYYTPTSYVSLDVNPSIEYSLNTFDRVLSVTGVNDDGETILAEVGLTRLKNKSIEKAIKETINTIAKQGYFSNDSEGGVVIAVSDGQEEKAEALSEKLKETVEQAVEEEEADVAVEAMAVGEERVQEAKSLGVTPGKLNLVQKLQASAENPDDIDIEAWLDKPVKDIMKQTKENKAFQKGKTADDDEDLDDTEDDDETDEESDDSNAKNSDKKAEKAAKKNNASDKSNGSDNGNSENKSENAASKDDGADDTDNDSKSEKKDDKENGNSEDKSNGSANKNDEKTNNGQAKKAEAQAVEDSADSVGNVSETSEKSNSNSDKSNSGGKSNNSSKNGNSKK